jgi:hypothetical protein
MAAEIPDWNIDISDEQLAGLYSFADSRTPAPAPRFLREQTLKRRIRLLSAARQGLLQTFEQVDLTGSDFEVGIGPIDVAPTGGTFGLSYNGNSTGLTALAYNITDTALAAALNANAAVSAAGGVTVTKTGQLYTIVFTTVGDKFELATDNAGLYPPSSVIPSTPLEGTASIHEIQTLQVIQRPYAFQDSWAAVAEGTVAATTVYAGNNEKPAKYKVTFTEPPMSGSVRVDHQVSQITEITTSANTASKAQVQVDFSPVTGSESTFAGEFLDIYTISNSILRFWFNHFAVISTCTADAGTDVITVGATHNLAVNDKVRFSNSGGALPGGISADTTYFVKTVPTGTTLTISATLGGATLDITSVGTGTHSILGGTVAASAPAVGTLIEVVYTTVATLVTNFLTAVDAQSEFDTPSTQSQTRVGFTYALKGLRTAMSLDGAVTLSALTTKMVTNGTDGIHAGRYLFLSDRLGLTCVYFPSLMTLGICTVVAATDVITVSAAHGLVVGDRVRFSNSGGALPAGISAATDYYVLTVPLTTTLTISATPGGSVLDITGTGTGTHSIHRYGLTTSEPTFPAGVSANRFLPAPIIIDDTASGVATFIGAAIDADAEFTAAASGTTVTVTDAFGGPRADPYVKTVTFGVSVKRSGFSLSASIPWDFDANTISVLLDDQFIVSKPDELNWLLTKTINGVMPDLTATDESLEWPSRMEGTLDFDTLALHQAFAATTAQRIDAKLEVVWIPDGGARRVVLQIQCELYKNLLLTAGMSAPGFPNPLTSVKTGNTLWVDAINGNDSTAIRGRLDKPFLTIGAAQTAATAEDTVKVWAGSYTADAIGTKTLKYDLDPGTTITASVDQVFNLSTAVTVTIRGNGAKITSAGGQTVSISHASAVFTATDLTIECTLGADHALEISTGTVQLDRCTLPSVGGAVDQSGGTVRARRSRFSASGAAANGIDKSGGTMALHGNEVIGGASAAAVAGSGTVLAWNNIWNIVPTGVTISGAGNTTDSNLT